MPRTINFEPHFDAITSKYGQELDADMVKEYVANNPDVSYQTVTKYLNKWKISRGKWNIKTPQQEKKSKSKKMKNDVNQLQLIVGMKQSINSTF